MLPIETKRLILRNFNKDDLSDMYEFMYQLKDNEFEGYPGITLESAKNFLDYRIGNDEYIALVLKENNKLIGNIYFGNRDFNTKELGYIINKDYQRKGYATEAINEIVNKAFSEGLHRVYAECDPLNDCSWNLLESLGFNKEAHLKQNIYFVNNEDGSPKWKDTYIYSKLNNKG